jgi:DNA repair exonuclease SbcCD nuclease subunit
MTRFIFITDTHLGAHPMGYQQQRGYPEKLPKIVAGLKRWIAQQKNVGFLLHGGDMVDACRADLIEQAVQLMPCYLCLGNHDLTCPDAVAQWMAHAPSLFVGRSPHFELVYPDCVVHVVPNHWEHCDYYWAQVQSPAFRHGQLERISQAVTRYADRPHVLCTHSPVFGIEPKQTGFADPYHDPGSAFRRTMLDLLQRHPQIRLVLTGHNHINSLTRCGGAAIISSSAFAETPFEFKLIEVEPGQISVRTLNLRRQLRLGATYDFDKTFVQGRLCDRQVRLSL